MTDIAEALTNATIEVLEEAAFVFVEPIATPGPMPDPIRFDLLITGSRVGRMRLTMPRSLAIDIATTLLGEDGQMPEMADAITGEMLNVIAGRFVSAAFGDDQRVALSHPEPSSDDVDLPVRAAFEASDSSNLVVEVEALA